MTLEGLKVEALLLLEQAGIKRSDKATALEDLDLSSDLSNQITEDLPQERSPGHSQQPEEQSSEGDLLEELENYVSPLELMERELAELAAQEEQEVVTDPDPLEEALSLKTTERATLKPEAAPPVRPASLATAAELDREQFERRPEPPTRKIEPITPPLDAGQSDEPELAPEALAKAARQLRANAEPSDPALPQPPVSAEPPVSAQPPVSVEPLRAPSATRRMSGAWKRAKLDLKGVLLPMTRSPDAELAVYGSGPRQSPVDQRAPWLRVDEVSWQDLDWRVIEEQLGPYASISMAPRSFSPRAQLTRRPVELKLEERGYLAGEQTIPSAPPLEMEVDDSIDLEDAFAEYDEPVSDAELREDPELADMADAYSALEMSLMAPDVQRVTDEFSDRDGLFEDSLAPRVSAHLEAEYGDDHDETGSLDELLAVNPLDEEEEMVFDFGEDSPLVWTEGSPTPMFSEEPTPSPVFQRGRRTQGTRAEEASPNPDEKEAQRPGVLGRLFNKGN